MFGSEQALVQPRVSLKYLYRLIGEYRFPLRLRGYYLTEAIPLGFSPKTIWDAGCGAGHTTFFLARRFPAARVTGTDLNPRLVAWCRQIARLSNTYRIDFAVQDLTESWFENAYDLVVCFEVLEHITDYDRAIQNLSLALRTGGYLIVHTPAAGRFQAPDFGLRRFSSKPNTPSPAHEKGQFHVRPGFRLKDLIQSLQHHGLEIDSAKYTFGPLTMFAHTLYELTRSRSFYMVVTYPFLMGIASLEWHLSRSRQDGGGLLVWARKRPA